MPLIRTVFLAAAAASLAAAPLAAQEQPKQQSAQGTTVVVGQFIDATTNAPVAGVNIKIPSARVHVVTGPDGQFQLRLRPGTHGVAVARLGYETVIEQWEVGAESLDMGIMKLQPDAVLLEGITATADRLERVRRAFPFPSRTYTAADLINNASFSAADFVLSRSGTMAVSCGRSSFSRNCVRYRGGVAAVCVVIDDRSVPGGLSELEGYQTHTFARMHVYRGGTFVQAYTNAYLKLLARRNEPPMDALTAARLLCRNPI